MSALRLAIQCPDRQLWVDHCRPRTSAVRHLNLGVSFPAVRSLTLLSLADPKQNNDSRDSLPRSGHSTA